MRHPIVQEDLATILRADLPWERDWTARRFWSLAQTAFCPAYLVEALLLRNEQLGRTATQVIGLVRSEERARRRFLHYAGREDLRFLVQDVSEPVKINEKVDIIVHAASQASPKHYGTDPVGTLSANVLGTYHLLQFARKHGTERFLFFSSSEVYGQSDPTQVRSCYGESKRMGETMCAAWHHQHGVPAVIVRPFHTYGPGMALDDGRVFADFVADIVAGRDIVMKSDGQARRAFCYLADATAGFFTVLLKGQLGQAYDIGNNRAETSILELAQRLAALFPEKGLQVVPQALPPGYLPSATARSCPDITQAGNLGWQPATTIEDGFSRTVRSFE